MLRLCFYFFMLFSLPAGAQIDSLKRELSYAKTDTAKISLYIQLAFESGDSTALHYAGEAVQLIINKLPQSAGAMQKKMYGYYSDAANAEGNYFEQQEIYDSSLYYYSNALMYARQAGDKLRESDQLIYAGLIYYYKNDIRRAIDYTAKSIEIKEQLKDETGLRRAYNNLAYFFKETGNINRCLELNFKALEIAERAGDDDDRGTTFNNIGQVYQENQKDYAKALDFYNKALLIYRRLNSKLDIALELNNISSVYAALGRYSDAVSYAQQSLTLRMEENNRYGIVQTLNNIGNDYLRMKKFDSARLYLVRADAANQSLQNKFLASYIHSNMSELYEYAGLLDSALYHGKCCFQISGSSGYPGEVARAAAMMSRLLEKKKDFKNALYYHQVADKMNDSIYNDNNKKAFLKIELEYEYQKKQAAAEEVFRQKQLHDNLVKWVLGILFLSAVVIGFILYNRYKIKKQLEQTQLRNKIASDLHDDVGATLSSIRMYSGVIQKQLREKNETGARKLLDKISENSEDMVNRLNELVWFIKPGNDTLSGMEGRMMNFASPLCASKEIQFTLNNLVKKDDISLGMEVKKDVFLIFKEAVNNAIKYGHCTCIEALLENEGNHFILTVKDNGKGFDAGLVQKGNGLENMKQRVMQHKGKITVTSNAHSGTVIKCVMPFM